MARRVRVDQAAESFAADARRQFSELRRALRAAQADMARLRGTFRTPRTGSGRRSIPGSRSGRPSLFVSAGVSSIANYFSRSLVSAGGGFFDSLFGDESGGASSGSFFTGSGFEPSQTQLAGQLFDAAQRAQRIR